MPNEALANSVHLKSRAEWRAWLAQHHEHSDEVWLVALKKATSQTFFEDAEAVEEALCFGWVDSKPGKLHDERSMRHFRAAQAKKWMR